MDFTAWLDTQAAPGAFAADLASKLNVAATAPVHRDDAAGFAILTNGQVIDWSAWLDRPTRLSGTTRLGDPESFASWVVRHRTTEAAIFADRNSGTLTAVFNGPPPTADDATSAADQDAGYGDHRAVLTLDKSEDYTAWERSNAHVMDQLVFGQLLDELGHTMVAPDEATMIEIATTLTGKTRATWASRTRSQTGEVSFSMESETELRAGKGATSIDIPERFRFSVPVWEGTAPVEFGARLVIQPQGDGVKFGYKILRRVASIDAAFAMVIDDVADATGVPIFRGTAADSTYRAPRR